MNIRAGYATDTTCSYTVGLVVLDCVTVHVLHFFPLTLTSNELIFLKVARRFPVDQANFFSLPVVDGNSK